MHPTFLVLLLLTSGAAAASTVYKWVDANGVTHYSDQPHPGATTIQLESAQTYTAPLPPNIAETAPSPAESGPAYTACEFYRPSPEEVLFSVTSVTAKLRLDPELRSGDQATIALDGARLKDVPMVGNEFDVKPVYRGTHKLAAVVEDANGKVVCQTPAVTFHVRQPSVLSPQSPQRPKPPPKKP